MDKNSAIQLLNEINSAYQDLKIPKYKQIPLKQWKEYLVQLQVIKQFIKDDITLKHLLNAISQIVAKLEKFERIRPINSVTAIENKDRTLLMNTSERGVNKAIPCIRNKNEAPFLWIDESTGSQCCINNGYWDAKNSMLLDILGYMFLMKEGGDIIPKIKTPIFNDIEKIKSRETELKDENNEFLCTTHDVNPAVEIITKRKYWIKFDDKDFRELTSKKINTNSILDLIHKTSMVEFKITYPARIIKNKKSREQLYTMNVFSRLFEFGYIDKDVRGHDKAIRCREYYVSFNTILGELFVHNLKALNFDWIHREFYNLPGSAQIFYKRFILNHNYSSIVISLSKISKWLDLSDKNITNLINTVESNILGPLKKCNFIEDYSKENGQNGIKFNIKINR
jgi:hypothetical protein